MGSEAPTALPGRSRCPICQHSQLYIFEDFAHSGQWSFCHHCQRGTDLTGLAALSWDVDLTMAVSRLRRSGLSTKDIHADAQRDKLASAFAAGNGFWGKISSRIPADQEGSQDLIDRLGWNCRVSAEHKASTVGKLYGIATRSEVELFWPHADFAKCEDRVYSREWKETLVVPFRDLPGRLCGLLMIGRNADPEKDYAYKPLFPGHSVKGKGVPWVEGGLSMHPLSPQISRRWGARFVAIRDIELGMRLQCSHLERDPYPLPITLWYSKRQQYKQYRVETRNSWAQLYGKDLIFWMPKPCGTTMAQAIAQNAEVSLMRPPEGVDWDSYYRYKSPEDIVAAIFQVCNNWREIFPKIVASLPDKELEEFLIDIQEYGISFQDLDLPSSTQLIINNVLGYGDRVKMVVYHGMTITDQGGAWYRLYAKSKPELLMDASIDITHVIHQPTEDRLLYKGNVIYRQEKVPFCVTDVKIEKRAMSFVKELLLAKRKGLITFPKKYDIPSLHMAMQFSKPDFITGLDKVGWNQVDGSLVFPSFSIPLGKEPVAHDQSLFLEGAPCWDLRMPAGVAAADTEIIQQADENSGGLIWDLLSLIAATLVTPGIYGEETRRCVALSGLGAAATAKAAIQEFGGVITRVAPGMASTKQLKRIASRHDVPFFIENQSPESFGSSEERLFQSWLNSSFTNSVLPLTKWQFLAKIIESDWIGIESYQPAWITPAIADSMKIILSSYLAKLVKNHLELPDHENLVLSIRQDLEAYLNEEGVLSGGLGSTCIVGGTSLSKSEAFLDLLCHIVLQKALKWEINPKERPDKAIWTVGQELFIPKTQYAKAAYNISRLKPDRESITTVLAQAGKLVGETESYWIVDSTWWSKEFKKQSAMEKKMLKLIS